MILQLQSLSVNPLAGDSGQAVPYESGFDLEYKDQVFIQDVSLSL